MPLANKCLLKKSILTAPSGLCGRADIAPSSLSGSFHCDCGQTRAFNLSLSCERARVQSAKINVSLVSNLNTFIYLCRNDKPLCEGDRSREGPSDEKYCLERFYNRWKVTHVTAACIICLAADQEDDR